VSAVSDNFPSWKLIDAHPLNANTNMPFCVMIYEANLRIGAGRPRVQLPCPLSDSKSRSHFMRVLCMLKKEINIILLPLHSAPGDLVTV